MGSILTTLLVFGATPAVLLTVVGDPLGNGMGHQWSLVARLLLAALALVAWVAWAVCCTQLARAVVEQVRSGHVGAPAGAALTDKVAARIAAGVLSLLAIWTPLAMSTGAGATGPHGAVTVGAVTVEREAPAATPSSPAPSASPGTPATAPATYVVRPGDSLWSIAAARLGDGDDWPAIAALNLGRTMADGLQFVDPNRIHAGWTLLMPDQPEAVTSDVEMTPVGAAAPLPASPAPMLGPPRMELPKRWIPVTAHADVSRADGGAVLPFQDDALVLTHPESLEGAGPVRLDLPELAALGIGALACAALARRARRTRLLRQITTEESDPAFSLSPPAIDADILLARAAGLPALRAFEAANYGLAAALADRPLGTVAIRAVCVGAAGVDFWLADAGQPAPRGLTLSPDGRVWHAPHGTFSSMEAGSSMQAGSPVPEGRPLLPIVLPVGEDDRGTWLVPLGPGSCLPLLGEDAPALWRAARPVQEAWSWADMVLVTEDPLVASGEVQLRDGGDGPAVDLPQVLYFGDPAVLPDAVAQKVSTVTLTPGPASDVTVLVDRRGASIHPLGRTVRPHLMGERTSRLVRELVEPSVPRSATPAAPGAPGAAGDPTPGGRTGAPPTDLRRPPASVRFSASHPAPETGFVEVRLLTPAPRLVGLSAELPPNRARSGRRTGGLLGPARGRGGHQRPLAHARPRARLTPMRHQRPSSTSRRRRGAPWGPTRREPRCSHLGAGPATTG